MVRWTSGLSVLALLAGACNGITPTYEVDLCEGPTPDGACQKCHDIPRHPGCPQCEDDPEGCVADGGALDATGTDSGDGSVIADGGADGGPVDADAPGVDAGDCGTCPAETPNCDTSGTTPTCTGCEGAADCSDALPICDLDTNLCVQCEFDSDCDDFCAEGACVECRSSSDCSAGAPVCSGAGACEGCTAASDCSAHAATPACRSTDGACVECTTNTDCPATAPVCGSTNTCEPCSEDADCDSHASTRACTTSGPRSGQCVECTLAREDLCTGNVCIPDTETCHATKLVDSRNVCESCEFDSECTNGDLELASRTHRCIALNFQGSDQGGHCLRIAAQGCQNPYRTFINAVSLSGEPAEDYCGINQALTTCAAVLNFADACIEDAECGLDIGDARCASFGGADSCTYFCTNDLQCETDTSCLCPDGTSDGCNVDTERYCQ